MPASLHHPQPGWGPGAAHGAVMRAAFARPQQAGSQGIPCRGLDFPAEITPITRTESFSIKPAAAGLETMPRLRHLHNAAIASGRPHHNKEPSSQRHV